jgi:DNA-binding beta-propeller fold protein YncE
VRARAVCAALLAAAAALALVALLWPQAVPAGNPPPATLAIADLRGGALLLGTAGTASPRRIALPGHPHELVQLPDGRLVLSLEQAGRLALVTPASGAVETIEVGGLPHGLAVSGGLLYATDRSSGTLRRWDPRDWSELPALPAGATPHAVAPTADGGIAIADAAGSTLLLHDHAHAVSELPETVAADPRSGQVAVAGAHGGDLELFAADGRRERRVALGGRPVRALFGARGTLAVALSADGAVALVDAAGAVRRVPVGGVPDGLAFDASGRWLYVSGLHGEFAVVDVERARVRAVWDAGGGGALLVLAPPATAAVRQ